MRKFLGIFSEQTSQSDDLSTEEKRLIENWISDSNPKQLRHFFLARHNLRPIAEYLAENAERFWRRALNCYINYATSDANRWEFNNAESILHILTAYSMPLDWELFNEILFHSKLRADSDSLCNHTNKLHNDTLNTVEAIKQEVHSFTTASQVKHYMKLICCINEISTNTKLKTYAKGYANFLNQLNTSIDKKTSLKQLQFILKKPNKFIVSGEGTNWMFPFLNECACPDFNRKRRITIEEQIIDFAKGLQNCETPLIYMSLGSGGLLQDFFIVSKLLLQQHLILKVVLIDSANNIDKLRQFKQLIFIAAERHIQLSIEQFPTISEYHAQYPNEKAQLITSIDFKNIFKDEVFDDVMITQSLLAENGKFFFLFDNFEFYFSPHRLESFNTNNSAAEVQSKYISALKSFNPKKETISIATLCCDINLYEWLLFIPELAKKPACHKLQVTLVQPRTMSYVGTLYQHRENKGFSQQNLQQFLSLITGNDVTIELKMLHNLDEIDTLTETYDIMTLFGIVRQKDTDAPNTLVEWLDENHSDCLRMCEYQLAHENNRISGVFNPGEPIIESRPSLKP